MNNLGCTDHVNAVLQLLNAVPPLREYFLLNEDNQDELLEKFGMLFRKLWSWQQFKGCYSPHELMQAITYRSKKQFKIGKASDPVQLLVWLLDNLHKAISKPSRKPFGLANLFQGSLKTSLVMGIKNSADYEDCASKVEVKPFTVVRLEFPERGIFNKVENQV